jgi:SAM-dependent methyltransferase
MVWTQHFTKPMTEKLVEHCLEGKVVDLGCGAGGYSIQLGYDSSSKILGIDVNRDAVHLAEFKLEKAHLQPKDFIQSVEKEARNFSESFVFKEDIKDGWIPSLPEHEEYIKLLPKRPGGRVNFEVGSFTSEYGRNFLAGIKPRSIEAFIAIQSFEHVDPIHLNQTFDLMNRALKRKGLLLIAWVTQSLGEGKGDELLLPLDGGCIDLLGNQGGYIARLSEILQPLGFEPLEREMKEVVEKVVRREFNQFFTISSYGGVRQDYYLKIYIGKKIGHSTFSLEDILERRLKR